MILFRFITQILFPFHWIKDHFDHSSWVPSSASGNCSGCRVSPMIQVPVLRPRVPFFGSRILSSAKHEVSVFWVLSPTFEIVLSSRVLGSRNSLESMHIFIDMRNPLQVNGWKITNVLATLKKMPSLVLMNLRSIGKRKRLNYSYTKFRLISLHNILCHFRFAG